MPESQALRAFKAEFFKALAHPLRIQILDALRAGERGVGELRDELGVEAPHASQQLAVLRGKGIVATRKDGNSVYYRVADPAVFELLDVAKAIFGQRVRAMAETLDET